MDRGHIADGYRGTTTKVTVATKSALMSWLIGCNAKTSWRHTADYDHPYDNELLTICPRFLVLHCLDMY